MACFIFFLFLSIFYINLTPSIETGLYHKSFNQEISRFSIVNFIPPENMQRTKNFDTFMKKIIALPGDYVYIDEDYYFVNSVLIGTKLKTFSDGTALPEYTFSGEVPEGQFFVFGSHSSSLDSRYFGPISTPKILGVYKLLFSF